MTLDARSPSGEVVLFEGARRGRGITRGTWTLLVVACLVGAVCFVGGGCGNPGPAREGKPVQYTFRCSAAGVRVSFRDGTEGRMQAWVVRDASGRSVGEAVYGGTEGEWATWELHLEKGRYNFTVYSFAALGAGDAVASVEVPRNVVDTGSIVVR